MADMADEGAPPPRTWWVDALNPVENLRALGDAQQFGRRAAEDVAKRLFAFSPRAAGDGGGGGADAGEPELEGLVRRMRTDSVRAADLWADLIEGAAAMVGALVARLPAGGGTDGETADLDLGTILPGDAAQGVFWVHNSSTLAVDEVRPHCHPPRDHLGDELPGVTFDPPALAPLPPRSRCGIEARVTVPATIRPGVYVTVVQLTNLPDVFLPLRIVVASSEE